MKSVILSLICFACFACKGQDTLRYSVNGSTDTRLIKATDNISISIFGKEKNLQYRLVNVKVSFKRYDMKMLKSLGDTLITFPEKFSKNPVAVLKMGSFVVLKQADVITITAGEVIKKNKKGKKETATNVLGRQKEWQTVK